MEKFRSLILLIGLLAITLVLLLPAVDLPETAYNEADATVTQATASAVRTHSTVAPVPEPLGFAEQQPSVTGIGLNPLFELPIAKTTEHARLTVLCVFLC
jgi:hypothetical protein